LKHIFKTGDTKQYKKIVQPNETAHFESGEVHPVYSTFALARDAEWACRLFVLEMKESHEEGIGTMVSVMHHSPALTGQEVVITATIKSLERHEIICSYEARVGERLIATGESGQKILTKEKVERLFADLK
jgi:fluoroacetyl-CoA thioesterase